MSYYSNLFFVVWSNALPGAYALTAKATDNNNAFTVSLPVNITILPPSPPPTTVGPSCHCLFFCAALKSDQARKAVPRSLLAFSYWALPRL